MINISGGKVSANPRLDYLKKRDKESANYFYKYQFVFLVATAFIGLKASYWKLGLLFLLHASFFGLMWVIQCMVYYLFVCLTDVSMHYEYTMMVLLVHSTITLPGLTNPKVVFLILSTFLSSFVVFRMVNYIFLDFWSLDSSVLMIRKLNHTVFDLAPYGVMLFSGRNMELRSVLQRLAKQLKHTRLNQNRFIEKFAHCCRTYLNGISIFQTHIKQINTNPENTETLDLLEEGNLQTITLVNDLVDFHELKVKQLALHNTEGDLKNTIFNVIKINQEMLKMRLRKPHLVLRHRVEDNIPRKAIFDPRRFSQVMHNLLSNALKYTDRGHVSVLAYCEDKNHFFFEVIDTGPGIPKDKLEDVFTPFSSINHSSKPSLGLGLVISKEITMLMNGGKIEVLSDGLGKGVKATFSCRVEFVNEDESSTPSCPDEDNPSGPPSSVPPPLWPVPKSRLKKKSRYKLPEGIDPVVSKMSVLVVEDVVTNRAVMGLQLSKFGVKDIDFAENGLDALQVLHEREIMLKKQREREVADEEEVEGESDDNKIVRPSDIKNLPSDLDIQKPPYDVVLMDINMPVMDGYECTKRLRKRWDVGLLHVFAVTAMVFSKNEKKEYLECFNGIIRKPIQPEEMFSVLHSVATNRDRRASEISEVSCPVDEEEKRKARNNELNGILLAKCVKVIEKVHMSCIALLLFYFLFFSSGEVFQGAVVVACVCGSMFLLRNQWINNILVPFVGLIVFHLVLGPYCHSVRLFFLANIVNRSIMYYNSQVKAFAVLVSGFVVVAFFEFLGVSFYDYAVDSELFQMSSVLGRKVSSRSIEVDLRRINAIMDLLYVCQIIINMIRLVAKKKEGEEDMLQIVTMLEDDMVFHDNFAAKISHDLRTPIFASLFLLKKMEKDFARDPHFVKLRLCLNDLKREVDNLVDFYRLKHGKLRLGNDEIPLRELVINCVNDIIDLYKYSKKGNMYLDRKSAKKKPVEDSKPLHFIFTCKDIPVVAVGDKDRIEAVINNLISNAVEHTNEGSITITVTFKEEFDGRNGLIFHVKDTGSGIEPDLLERIFKSDFLFCKMNTLGLGLNTHRECLRLLGGSLTVESEVGKGTDVEAFFPMEGKDVGESYTSKLCLGMDAVESTGPQQQRSCEFRRRSVSVQLTEGMVEFNHFRKDIDPPEGRKSSTNNINNNSNSEQGHGKRRMVRIEEDDDENFFSAMNNRHPDLVVIDEEEEREFFSGYYTSDQMVTTKKDNNNSHENSNMRSSMGEAFQKRENVVNECADFHLKNKVKIGVVEDNIVCTRMMKYYLESMLGYQNVVYADTGQKAYENIDTSVDLCFIDFFLPDAVAPEMIQNIRNQYNNRHTKFCLCTGNMIENTLEKTVEYWKMLYKPLRLESIKLTITDFCENNGYKEI